MVWSLVIYAAGAGALAIAARRGGGGRGRAASRQAVAAACERGDRAEALAACRCPETDAGEPVHWSRVAQAYGDGHEAPLPLLLALVERESDFRPRAVRHEPCVWVADWVAALQQGHPLAADCCAWGSYGLTQVLFAVALDLAGDIVQRPADLFDVETSVEVGLRALDHWRDRYGAGGAGGPWSDALAGYNSGRRYADAPKRTQQYVDAILTGRTAWASRLTVNPRVPS